MASQVPYTGTQSVSPQVDPLSQVHVDTPVAAFGGAVAGAITHMGEVAQGAGKELFDRANAIQTLHNQDVANSALADYQNELTQNYTDFTKNQGQDATSKLPQFMQDTETLRQTYAGKMPSPEAAYLFNQESRQSRFRTVFGAANYTREEMKRFSTQSFDLRMSSAGDNVAASMPGDQATLDKAIDSAKITAGQKWAEKGYHPGTPEYDQAVASDVSTHIVSKNIRELAKTQPIAAEALRQKELKAGNLTETDSANLDPILERAKINQGSRATGNAILSGEQGDWGSITVGAGRGLEVLSKSSGTGGYGVVGKDDPSGNGHPVGKYGVPSSELPTWLKDAGMQPMTEQEFLANPKAQDQLAQNKLDSLQKQYGSFDETMKVWSSGIDTDGRIKAAHKALADTAGHAEVMGVTDRTASKVAPNDPMFLQATKDHVQTERTRSETFIAKDKFDNGNIVWDALLGVGSSNGKVPISRQELLASDPKVAEAYAKLDAKQQHAVDIGIMKNIDKGGYTPTIASQQLYEKLYGIAVNPDSTPTDRQKLIDTDPASLEMPLAQRQTLQKLRAKIYNGAVADPEIGHAMGVMGGVLKSYNLTPDQLNQFRGAFHDALQGYGEGQKKQVRSDDDIKMIGSRLLQAPITGHSYFGWWNTTGPMEFETSSDTKAAQMLLGAFTKQYGRDPNSQEQQQLNNALLRYQFQQVGAKAKPVKPGANP